MTRGFLDKQLERLMALRAMPGNSDGYWDALQDIPEATLELAMGHALKTRVWFPTPAEIRMDCDQVKVRVTPEMPSDTVYLSREVDASEYQAVIANPFGGKPLVVTVGRDWYHDCDDCGDTGWAIRRCLGAEVRIRQCGRLPPHLCQYPHDYAVKCSCIPTNPTIQRRYAASVKYAQEATRRG